MKKAVIFMVVLSFLLAGCGSSVDKAETGTKAEELVSVEATSIPETESKAETESEAQIGSEPSAETSYDNTIRCFAER